MASLLLTERRTEWQIGVPVLHRTIGKRSVEEGMANRGKILFLCTGNSCRSQMAEAWPKRFKVNQFAAYCAVAKSKVPTADHRFQ